MTTKELEKLEKIAVVKKHGGRRAGSGAKKGSTQNAIVVANEIKQLELADVQTSIKNVARKLLNSQTVAALGTWQIAVLQRDANGKIHYARVVDETEMIRLLDEGVHGKDYVVFAGEAPDWKAASDMLNRAGLKPKDNADPSKGIVNVFNLIASSEKRHANPS